MKSDRNAEPLGRLTRWLAAASVCLCSAPHLSAEGVKPRITLLGKAGVVEALSFSPDGKTLTSANGKSLLMWDVRTGKRILLDSTTGWPYRSVVFSPDGKSLATGQLGNTIKLWDLAKGKSTTLLNEGSQGPTSDRVVFAPDGKTLASGGTCCHEIRLWNVGTGKRITTIRVHDMYGAGAIAITPDGKTLASSCHNGTLEVWTAGKKVQRGLATWTRAASFSPDAKTLATAGTEGEDGKQVMTDKCVILWEVATGKQKGCLEGHPGIVNLAFSPDGKRLASGDWKGTIKLWDLATGKELLLLAGHEQSVSSLAFSPDGKTLASGSHDETIKLWDVAKAK